MTDAAASSADNEIADKIGQRFSHVWEACRGDVGPIEGLEFSRAGRPYADWHEQAIQQINELRAQGYSISKAASEVCPALPLYVDPETVRVAYYAFNARKNAEAEQAFLQAILTNDMPAAIRAWKALPLKLRRKWKVE